MTTGLPPGHPRLLYPDPETESPQPQRWQCALCLSELGVWETAHADALQAAKNAADKVGTPFIENFLPPEIRDSWPDVLDAVTIDTVPGRGTCAVCPQHVTG